MDLFLWLIRFALASRHGQMLRAIPVMRDLLFASRALYDELVEHAGFDFGFEGNGSLWVCLSKERLEHEKEETHLFEEFGIPFRVMDQSEIHDLEPSLLPQVVGGIHYPRYGHINPARFVMRLAEKAQSLGAQLWTKTEALGFESFGGKTRKIHTTRGDISPRRWLRRHRCTSSARGRSTAPFLS